MSSVPTNPIHQHGFPFGSLMLLEPVGSSSPLKGLLSDNTDFETRSDAFSNFHFHSNNSSYKMLKMNDQVQPENNDSLTASANLNEKVQENMFNCVQGRITDSKLSSLIETNVEMSHNLQPTTLDSKDVQKWRTESGSNESVPKNVNGLSKSLTMLAPHSFNSNYERITTKLFDNSLLKPGRHFDEDTTSEQKTDESCSFNYENKTVGSNLYFSKNVSDTETSGPSKTFSHLTNRWSERQKEFNSLNISDSLNSEILSIPWNSHKLFIDQSLDVSKCSTFDWNSNPLLNNSSDSHCFHLSNFANRRLKRGIESEINMNSKLAVPQHEEYTSPRQSDDQRSSLFMLSESQKQILENDQSRMISDHHVEGVSDCTHILQLQSVCDTQTTNGTTTSDHHLTPTEKSKQEPETFYEVLPAYSSQQFTVYPDNSPADFLENGTAPVPSFPADAYPRIISDFPQMEFTQHQSQQQHTYEIDSVEAVNFEEQNHQQQQQFIAPSGASLGFVDGFQGNHMIPSHASSNHCMSSGITQMTRNIEETASISSGGSSSSAAGIPNSVYFWQYNAQCKGPKAVRLINECGRSSSPLSCAASPLSSSCYDQSPMLSLGGGCCSIGNCSTAAHSLPQYPLVVFEDPVQKRNDLVHCSKLRRGDGNDVTPNILRLRSMGDELDRLSTQITRQGEIIMAGGVIGGVNDNNMDVPHGYDLDMSGRIPMGPGGVSGMDAIQAWRVEEAKREKNKLASKICRLKKKAFHESNKIKYTGLGLEYKELASLITSLKEVISHRISPSMARLLQTNSSQSSAVSTVGKPDSNSKNVPEGALYNHAKWLTSTTHITRVAGRMDAFTEEVLSLAKSSHAKHPLIKRLSSGCNSGREVATKFPITLQPDSEFESIIGYNTTTNENWNSSTPFPSTPASEGGYSQHLHSSPSASSLTAFCNGYETAYHANNAPRIPSAMDLSIMRECEAYMRPLQSGEWFDYSQYTENVHHQQFQQNQLQQQQQYELYPGYSCDAAAAFIAMPSSYAPATEGEGSVFYAGPSFYEGNEVAHIQYETPSKMGPLTTDHVSTVVGDQSLESNCKTRLPVIM